jgi:aminopeptidase N
MFNYLAYPKGSWVLHMLRAQLGDDLYRRCIKTYLERHAYGSVVTEDLRAVIEQLSGRSFDQFFDQWLYHGLQPELQATYSWDETTRLAKISLSQNQKTSDAVLLFKFPLKIRFKTEPRPSGSVRQPLITDRTIEITQRQEDFYFPLDRAPDIVRLGPDYTLLAKITFPLPTPMLYAQLADQDDAIGRILAMDQLDDKRDKETVAKLKHVLNDDPFFGSRVEASRALRQIHTDEARDALLASTTQSDARVRRAVVADIAGFYAGPALQSALKIAQNEQNPDIQAAALRALGGYSAPECRKVLENGLKSPSFHNELAEASIAGIRSQDDPSYIPPLLDLLSKTKNAFTARGYAQALDTLAYLARNEEKKDNVREFLVPLVNDPRERIQIGAISALGILGDPAALSVVERFATATKESPEQRAAERAMLALRETRKPVDDFKNLRQEVLDLQKTEHELRKDLDSLKKSVQAQSHPTNAPPTKKSSSTSTRK